MAGAKGGGCGRLEGKLVKGALCWVVGFKHSMPSEALDKRRNRPRSRTECCLPVLDFLVKEYSKNSQMLSGYVASRLILKLELTRYDDDQHSFFEQS